MLNSLSIKNIAVIDNLEINLKKGFNILTGETGAGKSIIIDSINMILGMRADRELVRHGAEYAFVQAVFDADGRVIEFLLDNDIDTEDGQIIITRRITSDGKSTAKINGCAVTLGMLRDTADMLVNIHGQHDNQALLNPSKHILFLDEYAENETLLSEYKAEYRHINNLKAELLANSADEQEKLRRMDLLKYQINEITSAKLVSGEEEELKNRRDILENAEKISAAANEAYTQLYDGGELRCAYDGLSIAVNALSPISDLNDDLQNIYNSLSEAMYSIEDNAHELKNFAETVEYDEAELNEIEDRLELLQKLKRKYGNTVEDILAFCGNAQKELETILISDEKAEELTEEIEKEEKKLKALAQKLSKTRLDAAKILQDKIENSLHELNMEKAKFSISVLTNEDFSSNGCDEVEFLISTNPGEDLKPLVKIASGGELSRVMLAIKSALAGKDDVETLIFDEIDTGVSGNAALKIAKKLKQLACGKQVLCITHLPQIAAAGDTHFLITKNVDDNSATVSVTELDSEGRITELSRIIDGGKPSASAREYAKEMLGIV